MTQDEDDNAGWVSRHDETALARVLLLDLRDGRKIPVPSVTHDIDEAIFPSGRICVITASLGRIKAGLSVALPRPPGNGLTGTREFQQLRTPACSI